MSMKGAAKGIAKGLANAATAKQRMAVKAASGILKAAGVDKKVTKRMDKVAKGFYKGGKVSRYAKMKREGMAKGGVVHHNSLKDIDKSYNTMKIEGEK
jgi:hypothetical protein